MGSAHPGRRNTRFRRPHDQALRKRYAVVLASATVTAVLVGTVLARAEATRRRWGETSSVVVTTGSVAAGTELQSSDLRVTTWPTDLIPDGAFDRVDAVTGNRSTTALSPGTALTPDLTVDEAQDEREHVTVRAGPESPPLEEGGIVAIWATTDPSLTGGAPGTRKVAEEATVISSDEERIVLAVSPEETADVVEASVLSTITLVSEP